MTRETRFTILGVVLLSGAGAALGLIMNPAALHRHTPPKVEPRPFVSAAIDVQRAIHLFDSSKLFVLDLRPRAAFEEAHIPGAFHIDPSGGEPSLRTARRFLPLNHPCILVLGVDGNDINAIRLASVLRVSGYPGTRVLEGGFAAWLKQKGAVARGWDMDVVLAGVPR